MPKITKLPAPLSIFYSKTVDQLKNMSNYDFMSFEITSQLFPNTKNTDVKMEGVLIDFDDDRKYPRGIESDEVIKELDKMGLRPADHHELLSFGAQHPKVQKEFPVVGLGSSPNIKLNNVRVILSLNFFRDQRELLLEVWGGKWAKDRRFLAFKK